MIESGDLSRQHFRVNVDAMFLVSFVWPAKPGSAERYAAYYTKRKSLIEQWLEQRSLAP